MQDRSLLHTLSELVTGPADHIQVLSTIWENEDKGNSAVPSPRHILGHASQLNNRYETYKKTRDTHKILNKNERYKEQPDSEVVMFMTATELFETTSNPEEQRAIANSVKLAIIMTLKPTPENIDAVKKDALSNAQGKPASWMNFLGKLLILAGVVSLALVGAASAPVTAGVSLAGVGLSSISFGSGVGAYVSGGALALGITGGILFFNGRQKGLSKALTNLTVEAEKTEREVYRQL